MTRLLLIIALAASFLASILCFGPAAALAASEEGHVCFFAMDANRDGFLDWEEFAAVYGEDSQELFASLDTDGDGLLVHEEYHDAVE